MLQLKVNLDDCVLEFKEHLCGYSSHGILLKMKKRKDSLHDLLRFSWTSEICNYLPHYERERNKFFLQLREKN